MDWKEQFKERFGDEESSVKWRLQDIESFFETQLEALIDEIPELDKGHTMAWNGTDFKKQLKAKWLGKE